MSTTPDAAVPAAAPPQRRLAITKARRRTAPKLDEAKVAAIRAAPTGKAAAEAHGIHLSMASRIRRGEAWRPLAAGASVFCQG